MRTFIISGIGVIAFGALIVGLAWVFEYHTRNDGGGANIGAGVLAVLGIVVAVLGLVMTLIATGRSIFRRSRSAAPDR